LVAEIGLAWATAVVALFMAMKTALKSWLTIDRGTSHQIISSQDRDSMRAVQQPPSTIMSRTPALRPPSGLRTCSSLTGHASPTML